MFCRAASPASPPLPSDTMTTRPFLLLTGPWASKGSGTRALLAPLVCPWAQVPCQLSSPDVSEVLGLPSDQLNPKVRGVPEQPGAKPALLLLQAGSKSSQPLPRRACERKASAPARALPLWQKAQHKHRICHQHPVIGSTPWKNCQYNQFLGLAGVGWSLAHYMSTQSS